MNLVNLSAEPEGKLRGWLPHDLEMEEVIFLPDACPGKSPLPTGTAVLTKQENWRKFAISDCGCGMRLLKSTVDPNDLEMIRWEQLADKLRQNKGRLGDLGGGNHFLDALESNEEPLHFLIHTGSRDESGHVDHLIEKGVEFDKEFDRVVCWAESNRSAVQDAIESIFGRMEIVLDLPHNTYEIQSNGSVIIRKGCVRVESEDLIVIPSHMSGDVLLAKAKPKVGEILNSLSHGTGRTMSRSECKEISDGYDYADLRQKVLIPESVDNASLRTEGPFAYRDLDDCLNLVRDYVEEVNRFAVVAYLGHL
ncbi:MAG: RtcB family protein [SAR324 cluster bacterium]|nr:RtcB family protein [SAR324 cluster bacterium]